jgi:hypothetical protein
MKYREYQQKNTESVELIKICKHKYLPKKLLLVGGKASLDLCIKEPSLVELRSDIIFSVYRTNSGAILSRRFGKNGQRVFIP